MRKILILLATLFLPAVAMAANATNSALSFTPPQSDVSMMYLGALFGLVDGVLYGTGSQIVGKMFGVFNSAILALGGIVLMYTLLVSTLNTAQSGEMLGKKFDSIWVPIRSVLAVALLLPKASGYCMIQIFIMWVVIQGVGAADKIWASALDYLASGGVLVQPSLDNPTTAGYAPGKSPVDKAATMLNSLVCMKGLEQVLNDARTVATDNGFDDPGVVPDLTSLVNISGAPGTLSDCGSGQQCKSYKVFLPSNLSGSPYADLEGICGNVSWTGINQSDISRMKKGYQSAGQTKSQVNQLTSEAELARSIALQQMFLDLGSTASQVADNYLEDKDSKLTLGKCSPRQCRDPFEWVASSGDKSPLLTGYELKNSVNVYNAIMQPTLNALQMNLEDIQFIGKAKSDGWIMAGAYFFDLVKLNRTGTAVLKGAGSFSTAGPKGVTLNASNTQISFTIEKDKVTYPGSDKAYNEPLSNLPEYLPGGALATDVKNYLSYAKRISMRNASSTTLSPEIESAFRLDDIGKVSSKSCEQIPGKIMGWCMWKDFVNGVVIKGLVNSVLIPFANEVQKIIPPLLSFLGTFWTSFTMLLISALNTAAHPILSAAAFGNTLFNIGIASWIAITIAVVLLNVSGILVGGVGGIVVWITPLLTMAVFALITYGITLSYYVPLIPYVVFVFAALAWLVAVIEAMVAGPIVALGVMHPEDHEVFGKGNNAIMLLTNVFLRPSMTVMGFIIGIMLSYVGIWFLNYSFSVVIVGVFDNVSGFTSFFAPLILVGIYSTFFVHIVQKTFDIIHILPDKVLRWIGGSHDTLGGEFAGGAAGKLEGATKSAGGSMEKVGGSAMPKPQKADKPEGGDDSTAKPTGGGGDAGGIQTGGNATPTPPAGGGQGGGGAGGGAGGAKGGGGKGGGGGGGFTPPTS